MQWHSCVEFDEAVGDDVKELLYGSVDSLSFPHISYLGLAGETSPYRVVEWQTPYIGLKMHQRMNIGMVLVERRTVVVMKTDWLLFLSMF